MDYVLSRAARVCSVIHPVVGLCYGMSVNQIQKSALSPEQRLLALRKISIFKGLNDNFLRSLAEQMEETQHAPGEIVTRPGDPVDWVGFILHGWINTRMHGVTVRHYAPGDPIADIGVLARVTGAPVLNTVVEELRMLRLAAPRFIEAVERAPKLAQNLMRLYCNRQRLVNLVRFLHQLPERPAAPLPTEGDRVAILRALPLFQGVDNETFLQRLASNVKEVFLAAGSEIYKHGTANETMFLLVSGEAEARLETRSLGTLSPGHTFGELGLIDGEPHPCSLIAVSDCRFLTLSRSQLFAAISQSPTMTLNMLKILAWRTQEAAREMAREIAAVEESGAELQRARRLPYLEVPESAWAQDPRYRTWLMPLSGDLTRQLSEVTELADAVQSPAQEGGEADFLRALTEEQQALRQLLREQQAPPNLLALSEDLYPRLRGPVHPKRAYKELADALLATSRSSRPVRLRAVLASPTAVAEVPSFLATAQIFVRHGLPVELRALLVRWENLIDSESTAGALRDERFQGQLAAVQRAFTKHGFDPAAVEPVDIGLDLAGGELRHPCDAALVYRQVAEARSDLATAEPGLGRDLAWLTGFYERQASLRRLGLQQPLVDLALRRYVGGRFSHEAKASTATDGAAPGPALFMLTSELHKRFLNCYSASVPILNISLTA